jgi:hypothetical protein
VDDAEFKMSMQLLNQHSLAAVATRACVKVAKELKFSLSTCGYALGGCLAKLTAHMCTHELDYPSIRAVVFDSPGTMPIIESDQTARAFNFARFDMRHGNIIEYLTRPNLVNCTHRHVNSKCYKLSFSVEKDVIEDEGSARLGEYLKSLPRLGDALGSKFKNVLCDLRPFFGFGIADLLVNICRDGRPDDIVMNWPFVDNVDNEGLEFDAVGLMDRVKLKAAEQSSSSFMQKLIDNFDMAATIGLLVRILEDRVDFDEFTVAPKLITDKQERVKGRQKRFYLNYGGRYEIKKVSRFKDSLVLRDERSTDSQLYNLKMRSSDCCDGVSLFLESVLNRIRGMYEIEVNERHKIYATHAIKSSDYEIEQLRAVIERVVEVEPDMLKVINKEFRPEMVRLIKPDYHYDRDYLIEEMCVRFGKSNVLILTGRSGGGKSCLALDFATRRLKSALLEFKMVKWVNAETDSKIVGEFRAMLREHGEVANLKKVS